MPRKKIIGICKIENCGKPIDSLGWCTYHYQRWYRHGTTDLINIGKTKHSLIQVWRERHGYGSLCPEWHNDFWQFVRDVGERPSKKHYFYKIDRSKPFSKDNYKWVEHIRRDPNESEAEWNARRWQQRIKLKPSLKEYGILFRELLKDTGLSLDAYSKIYLEKRTAQNSLCAICNKPETGFSKRSKKTLRLAMDHCHKTKKLRDLLCRPCNQTLGLWEENINFLESAINYLQKHSHCPTKIHYHFKSKLKYLQDNCTGLKHPCEICGRPETRISKRWGVKQRLSVDHCHTTMTIRGLICASCNTALGRVFDSIPIIQNMIAYITRHKAT
jgi:hypothetical protein